MARRRSPLETVEAIAEELESMHFEPVLVGGMALVILGSQRVTRDYDFLVSNQIPRARELLGVMYRHGLRLVTKFSAAREVLRTVDNLRVAVSKVKMGSFTSLFFADEETGLRVDLLLDFPFPAHTVHSRAVRITLQSRRVAVAAPEDLLRMKEIASQGRTSSRDSQDLDFLRELLGRNRPS